MIQQWNHPQYIYLLIPMVLCALTYTYHLLWKRLRLLEMTRLLKKDAPRVSLIPFMIRAVLVFITVLAISTAVLILLPKTLVLVSFILAFAVDIVLIFLAQKYLLSLTVSMEIVDKQVLENFELMRRAKKKVSRTSVIRPIMLLLTMALLILAIMGPEGSEKTTRLRRTPLYVTIALDMSKSMDATDQPPSRREAAIDELNLLLDQSGGDEIGLVFFTTSAVIQAPQTLDSSAIKAFLRTAGTMPLPYRGTDLNEALRTTLRTFNEADDLYYADTQYETRRVVLVTDGETHTGDLQATLDLYNQKNIHIDILAMGTEEGAILVDDSGKPMQYQNQTVVSHSDFALLREIAEKTDGYFAQYTAPEFAAHAIIANWDSVRVNAKPSGFTSSIYRVQLYPYFLYPAYLLIILLLLHPVFLRIIAPFRRKRRKEEQSASNDAAVSIPNRLREP